MANNIYIYIYIYIYIKELYDQTQPHDPPILGVENAKYRACETLNKFQC